MTQIKDIVITKTIAGEDDFLIMQNPTTGETYKITKSNLLAGLSSGGSTPDPISANVIFASNFETLTDIKGHPVTGSAIISSNNKYFGNSSLYCDGSPSSYISVAANQSDLNITSDFTFDTFLNFTSLGGAYFYILEFRFSFLIRDKTLYIVSTSRASLSSTLSPKNAFEFFPPNLGDFPATTDYKYGYYISYDQNKMSTFDPGTSGTLKSTQIPQAFFEVCRALDAAENARNGANPGLTPRRNLSTTVSFDTGTIAVAATIPIVVSIQTDGTIKIGASDYLGSAYSTFVNGGGDLTSSNLVAAFLETASMLSASEKAVTPIENQPNNLQIQVDVEAGSATVSGNLPFTTLAASNGDVTIHAIDYL